MLFFSYASKHSKQFLSNAKNVGNIREGKLHILNLGEVLFSLHKISKNNEKMSFIISLGCNAPIERD